MRKRSSGNEGEGIRGWGALLLGFEGNNEPCVSSFRSYLSRANPCVCVCGFSNANMSLVSRMLSPAHKKLWSGLHSTESNVTKLQEKHHWQHSFFIAVCHPYFRAGRLAALKLG